MSKLTWKEIINNEGPEYLLINKYNGVYKIWATSETFPELVKKLLSQVPENHRIKIAEEILKLNSKI